MKFPTIIAEAETLKKHLQINCTSFELKSSKECTKKWMTVYMCTLGYMCIIAINMPQINAAKTKVMTVNRTEINAWNNKITHDCS